MDAIKGQNSEVNIQLYLDCRVLSTLACVYVIHITLNAELTVGVSSPYIF